MPNEYRKRPIEWPAISLAARFNAGWRCQFCGAVDGMPNPATGSQVRLQVAHRGIPKPDGTPGNKYDLYDNRPENLVVLCQRCHLNFDRADATRTRRRLRIIRQIAAGQLPLILPVFDDDWRDLA